MDERQKFIYTPQDSDNPVEMHSASIGVKFCQDMYLSTFFMDQHKIPYDEKDLEDGPWGRVLRIKKDSPSAKRLKITL